MPSEWDKLIEQLEPWWIETNGTGTDACSRCRPPYVCSWHSARLDDLADFVLSEKREARTQGQLECYKALKARAHSASLLMPFTNPSVKVLFEEVDEGISRCEATLTPKSTPCTRCGKEYDTFHTCPKSSEEET
jgi:hypothetical protein